MDSVGLHDASLLGLGSVLGGRELGVGLAYAICANDV